MTNQTPAGWEDAVSRLRPRSTSRCPRCLLSFGSTDLMLDHLSADHLFTGAHAVHAPESDEVVADLERAFRRPSRPRHRRRSVISVIVALLLLASAVAFLV